jgi:hypothetical protein
MSELPWMYRIPVVSCLYTRYVRWKLTRWVWDQIKDEDEQVIKQVWASPQAPLEDILTWVDEQIAATPRLPGLQWYKLFISHCDEATYQACIDGDDITLPEPITEWFGPRSSWWYAGRDQIIAELPSEHLGLVVSLTDLAASIMREPDSESDLTP